MFSSMKSSGARKSPPITRLAGNPGFVQGIALDAISLWSPTIGLVRVSCGKNSSMFRHVTSVGADLPELPEREPAFHRLPRAGSSKRTHSLQVPLELVYGRTPTSIPGISRLAAERRCSDATASASLDKNGRKTSWKITGR